MWRTMMNKGAILIIIVVLYQGTLGQFPGQTPGKYRNPRIQRYFQYLCRNTQCGFEQVCEIRPIPCFAPPCSDGPMCISTPGSTTKPGRCPPPYYIWTRRARCNTDYGCYGTDVCCHGYRGSQCRRSFQ